MQIKGRESGVGGYPNYEFNNLVDEVNDDRGYSKGMFMRVSGTISSTGSVSLRSSSLPIFRMSPLSLTFRAALGQDYGVRGQPNSVAHNFDALVKNDRGDS